MNVAPSPTTSTIIATHIHVTVVGGLEGTPADHEFQSGIDSKNENAVSLVAVLCGLVPCAQNSINNVRLANHSTDSVDETSDKILDPFYHPATVSSTSLPEEDSEVDDGALDENAPMHVSEGGKELTANNQPNNVGRNAAIGATVAVVIFVLFILHIIYKRKRRRRLMLSELDDQSTHSAGSTTFLPISPASAGEAAAGGSTPRDPAQGSYDHTSRVSMHRFNTNQTVSTVAMSPFASPPPPLPTRAGRSHSRPEMVQLPRPSRTRSTAPGQRRRPPPPPPPPAPYMGGDSSHSTSANNNNNTTTAIAAAPIDTSYNEYYPQPPTLIRQQSLILEPGRQRAATFSEIPGDELPPYVDPIEEAMSSAANSAADNDTTSSSSRRHPSPADPRPNPPPYHTIDLSR
ncbi:hypothetical protein LPJ59_004662 [Coemansia sp. RSA 2399]|nr:hypothetical protein LPJ59_004662 [Coemansia sp. RSA 2399]KAJ1897956.1 hypothetical protein LPJ81_004435 [Coemansia sp. IMI 209127]